MPTAITLASLQTVCGECADAIEDQDWPVAVRKYAKALAVLAGLPADASDAEQRMRLEQNLSALGAAIKQASALAGPDDGERMGRVQARFNQ